MRLRPVYAVVAAAIVGVLVLGARRSGPGAGGPEQTPSRYVIGFSQCDGTSPQGRRIEADLRAEAARHPGIEVLYADAGKSGILQVAHLENFIVRKVDAIVALPKDPVLLAAEVEKAQEAGVPVVVVEREVPTGKRACFVGPDEAAIGREAARYAGRLLNGEGRVAELWGPIGAPAAQGRSRGFHEAIRGTGIQVVAQLQAKGQPAAARALTAKLLRSDPEVALLFAHNDAMARAAARAVRDAGRAGAVRILGVGGAPGADGGCRAVLDGMLAATFATPPPAGEGLRQALKILAHEEVPSRVCLPVIVVDRGNAARCAGPAPSP